MIYKLTKRLIKTSNQLVYLVVAGLKDNTLLNINLNSFCMLFFIPSFTAFSPKRSRLEPTSLEFHWYVTLVGYKL